MRIKIINPNTTWEMTHSIQESAVGAARSSTEIVAVSPAAGPVSIESYYDEQLAIVGVLEEVLLGEKDSYDAYIIACFGDPGLYAAREITSAPVIGIAEAAMLTACMLAPKFSVLTVLARSQMITEELIRKYGLWERCASLRSTGLSVLDFENDPATGIRELKRAGEIAVREDGAEALLLGCAGMAGLEDELENTLKVPVINGVAAAVKMAESLFDLGKKTSKVKTFSRPEPKTIVGYENIFQLQKREE